MKKVITSALIYANGPVHIGHLVEYIQTDVYSRYCKLSGENAIYVCADDTHGAPIEINASKLGITPEQLIEKAHKEHVRDFNAFHIKFDKYYTTNSPENREIVEMIYNKLFEKGYIYTKEIEITYCEHCKRFLPDRYVKGTCPKCGAEDQYGDQCEKCNATYQPTDLINPYCAICGNTPTVRKTTQYFFKLSEFSDKLKDYVETSKFQPEIKKYLINWIKEGLKDWEISRDKPYFGFKIPGTDDKYFYVWFDAPVGYIGTTKKYCDENNLDWKEYWINKESKIVHVIGKDIIYFHFLFWPAMLMGADIHLPDHIQVHGFLNVNGEKMSKSRGTFLTAKDFLDIGGDPEYLRFFYTYSLSDSVTDFNFSEEDYKSIINSSLVGKFGNLVYRAATFLNKNFEKKTGNEFDEDLINKIDEILHPFIELMKKFKFRKAIELFFKASDLANKYFQDNAPWELLKTDKQKALKVLTTTLIIINKLNILISPVIPLYSKRIAKMLNLSLEIADYDKILLEHVINKPKIVFSKVDDDFTIVKIPEVAKLDLRVGKIIEIKPHPDADRLYLLKVDLKDEIRELVAGLRAHYREDELINKKIILLCNLKKAKIRGFESNGMLLAASDDNDVGVLTTDKEIGSRVYFEGIDPVDKFETLTIKEFSKIKITSIGNKVMYENSIMLVDGQPVIADKLIKGDIH